MIFKENDLRIDGSHPMVKRRLPEQVLSAAIGMFFHIFSKLTQSLPFSVENGPNQVDIRGTVVDEKFINRIEKRRF